MPYCDTCEHYYTPTALNDDGTCPTCGQQVEEPAPAAAADEKAPWHFKLLVVLLIAYLGWRFLQLFGVL